MPLHGALDRLGIGKRRGHVLQIAGREAATQVEHAEVDVLFAERQEYLLGIADRLVPSRQVALLRTDVKGQAAGIEAEAMGMLEDIDRHVRMAAELARQRPFGAFAIGQHPAEDAGAGSLAGDLFHLFDAIDGEQADTQGMGAGDIAFFLDGIAVGNPIRGGAGGQRHFDLGHRSRIEAGLQRRQQLQDGRGRVGLYRVIDAGGGKGLSEPPEIAPYDIEVDDEAGAVRSFGGQEIENSSAGHLRMSPAQKAIMPVPVGRKGALETPVPHSADTSATGFAATCGNPKFLPSAWNGRPAPHMGQ